MFLHIYNVILETSLNLVYFLGLLNQDTLPIENVVLLMCVHDLLQPHTVANSIVTQCMELVGMVDAASGQGYATLDSSVVGENSYLFVCI